MLPSQLTIAPLPAPPDATVVVPGSKSHTNRALVCAALARGTSHLDGVLVADDTEAMCSLLADLGLRLALDRDARTVDLAGVDGRLPPGPVTVDARQSGTTGRFALPMLACGSGSYVLDGDPQLRARPFDTLVDALGSLGVEVRGRVLPITVEATGQLPGGLVRLGGAVSSQFLSGLLLAAPCAASDLRIELIDEPVSTPYIDLTISTMRSFGADVTESGHRIFVVRPGGYEATDLRIEPDASAASYFFAAAAITGGRVRVDGLGRETVQGDLRFVDVLAAMGAEVEIGATYTEVKGTGELRGVEVDMSDISDTAQTLGVVAPFASSPTRVTGIGFIRRKETDRIAAVVSELRALGIEAGEEVDGFVVHPGVPRPGVVDTYDDHRMAMSFALLGLVHPGITIGAPSCVSKTFPDYFEVLETLRASSTNRSVT